MDAEVSKLEVALYVYRAYKDTPEKILSYHDIERVFEVDEQRAVNLIVALKKEGIISAAKKRGWLINPELIEPDKGEEYIRQKLRRYTVEELTK